MNYEAAKRILDRIKDGNIYPKWVIDTALHLTGDLEFDERSGEPRMGATLQSQNQISGETRSPQMVD